MLSTIISALIGGGGGFLGGEVAQSVLGMATGGGLDGIIGAVSGLLGGGAVAGLMGRGGDAAAAGNAAASGGINIKQILGGLAGGAGAGAIGQTVLGMIM